MSTRRVALEVDGDQVTVVEMSGDLAISSAAVNAGTLRDSVQSALKGFRQRRSDPPVTVALVVPGLQHRRFDVTAAEVSEPSMALEKAYPGVTGGIAMVLPSSPPEGSAASAFAFLAPPELLEELAFAMGGVRYEVFPAASCLPVDGVFVGLHMSASSLSVFREGRPTLVRDLDAGGLGKVAASISPGDPQSGLAMVSEALAGEGSIVVSAEISRHFRMVAREVSSEIARMVSSGRMQDVSEVCPFGVGSAGVLIMPALEESGLKLKVPQQIAEALTYLPLKKRLPSVSALGSAVGSAPPFVLTGTGEGSSAPEGRRGKLLPLAVSLAALGALSVVAFSAVGLASAFDTLSAHTSELERTPYAFRYAPELTDMHLRQGGPGWVAAIARLPESGVEGMDVSGLFMSAEGHAVVRLRSSSGLSGLPYAVKALSRIEGVASAVVIAVQGDGSSSYVDVRLEVRE